MSNNAGNARFNIIHVKLYVPIITLSTQGNIKLIHQLNIDQKAIYMLI